MKKRMLFVWTSADFSTFDVASGFHRALVKTGLYDIRDYRLSARIRYHATALGAERSANFDLLLRCASENIVIEAMKYRADVVFIISGLALHPDAIWYLRRVGIKTVVIFTESPYDDTEQREFHTVYPDMSCFTMERTSARDGWLYVPHSYDPGIHYKREAADKSGVLFLGTLWQSRIKLFAEVAWHEIPVEPTLIGTWVAPPKPEDLPELSKFYDGKCLPNEMAIERSSQAKVCLNPFRESDTAESLNPRSFELAASGIFQLSDMRAELADVFGETAQTFSDALTLENQLRYWLNHDKEREDVAEEMRRMVEHCTFDNRLQDMLSFL